MRGLALALCALLLAPGCSGDREPAASPSPTPILSRPMPSTSAELDAELTLVADVLATTGTDARAEHDRVQACIRLARLSADASVKKVAGARAGALVTASKACPGDPAAAAATVRAGLSAS